MSLEDFRSVRQEPTSMECSRRKVKCGRREWCWVYRLSGEDRKVVG